MPGSRWTVLVVPQGAGVSKEMQVSSLAVKCIAAAGTLFVVLAVAAAYSAITWAVDISRVGRLERRNATLEVELEQMQMAVTRLADTMTAIAERDRAVRLLAGLEPNDPDVQQAGVGGPAPASPTDELLSETPIGRQALTMREDLGGLIRRAQLLAGSFKQVVDTMSAHQDRLDRTPSIMPTAGFISSNFSNSRMHPVYHEPRAHQGIDLVAPRGTPILAPASGVVVDIGRQSGYGKIVTLDHGHGIRTRYAHCEEILVKHGQRVKRGDEIALVGNTGVATNYHVHYEVIVNGRHIDPRTFMFGGVIVD